MIAGSFLYRGSFFLRHDSAEEFDHLVVVGFAWIAREARVGHSIAGQLLEIAFDQTRARLGNLDVFGKLAHGRDGRVGCFFSAHARGVNAHRAGTSAKRSTTTGLLNSIAMGRSIAQATPCGVS